MDNREKVIKFITSLPTGNWGSWKDNFYRTSHKELEIEIQFEINQFSITIEKNEISAIWRDVPEIADYFSQVAQQHRKWGEDLENENRDFIAGELD